MKFTLTVMAAVLAFSLAACSKKEEAKPVEAPKAEAPTPAPEPAKETLAEPKAEEKK